MEKKQTAQGSAATAQRQKPKFREMSPSQKVKFVLKLSISILSFGFVFPNVMD